jgi:hypothetical protein
MKGVYAVKRIITVLTVAALMAAMVVAGAGSALAESFEIIERGSPNGARVQLWQFEDILDEGGTLGEFFGLDQCAGGDAVVTASIDGFVRRIETPSGQQNRQVFARADVSFTLDGVLYTGTILQHADLKDFAGTGEHQTAHLYARGEDGSTIQAHVVYDRHGEVESLRVVCPGS